MNLNPPVSNNAKNSSDLTDENRVAALKRKFTKPKTQIQSEELIDQRKMGNSYG